METDQWACCSVKNKDEIIYFTQCFFGLFMISFSMYQIVHNGSDANNDVWIATLSSTVAVFLPAPTMNRQRQ